MKTEIDRLLTEKIPKLTHFDFVTSVKVKGEFYRFKGGFYVINM